jgi:hypothetical protein
MLECFAQNHNKCCLLVFFLSFSYLRLLSKSLLMLNAFSSRTDSLPLHMLPSTELDVQNLSLRHFIIEYDSSLELGLSKQKNSFVLYNFELYNNLK